MKAKYDCSCQQDDSIIPDHLREGFSGFLIDMQLRHVLERANGNDPVVLGSFGELFECSKADFPTVEGLDGLVIFCLSSCTKVNIPERFMLKVAHQVLSLAKSMSDNANNEGIDKVMPIDVQVVVTNLQEPKESEQEAIARAFSDCADDVMEEHYERVSASDNVSPTYLEFVTARKSSLKALEYVRLEDLSSAKCGICCDKLSVGRYGGWSHAVLSCVSCELYYSPTMVHGSPIFGEVSAWTRVRRGYGICVGCGYFKSDPSCFCRSDFIEKIGGEQEEEERRRRRFEIP